MADQPRKRDNDMQVSIHTHKIEGVTIATELAVTTDWNPWLRLTVTPTDRDPLALPDEVTIHLSGLSIEEGYAFSDSWDETGHAIREWVNYRSTVENMDVES